MYHLSPYHTDVQTYNEYIFLSLTNIFEILTQPYPVSPHFEAKIFHELNKSGFFFKKKFYLQKNNQIIRLGHPTPPVRPLPLLGQCPNFQNFFYGFPNQFSFFWADNPDHKRYMSVSCFECWLGRQGGHNWHFLFFLFNLSEHVDHFKARTDLNLFFIWKMTRQDLSQPA